MSEDLGFGSGDSPATDSYVKSVIACCEAPGKLDPEGLLKAWNRLIASTELQSVHGQLKKPACSFDPIELFKKLESFRGKYVGRRPDLYRRDGNGRLAPDAPMEVSEETLRRLLQPFRQSEFDFSDFSEQRDCRGQGGAGIGL